MRTVPLALALLLAGCAGMQVPSTASAPIPNAGADTPPTPVGVNPDIVTVPGPGPAGPRGDQPTTGVEMQAPADME